jgi:hypothetical protein
MLLTAARAWIVIGSIVGASFAAPAMADDAPPDEPPATAVRTPRPAASADAVAEILGVSRGDVVSVLRTGGTLANLALEQGSSGEVLVEALLDRVDHRIDAALAAGTIDEARAAELRTAAAEGVDRLVFETHRRIVRPGRGRGVGADVLAAVEVELDLPRGLVVSHIRTGGTLAELADAHGSSGDDLVAAMLDVIDERLDRASPLGA